MRTRILCIVLSALAITVHDAAAQCRAADSVGTKILRVMTRIATGADLSDWQMRQIVQIPQVTASQVKLVTSKQVCKNILPVYNANTVVKDAATGQVVSTPSTQIYVVQIGNVYAALDRGNDIGGYATFVVVDGQYRLLGVSGL